MTIKVQPAPFVKVPVPGAEPQQLARAPAAPAVTESTFHDAAAAAPTGVRIDDLDARAAPGGAPLGWVVEDDGLAARIDQTVTPDRLLTVDELKTYWNLMLGFVNERQGKAGELTDAERQILAQIQVDYPRMAELLEAVQSYADAADLDATLAHRIDEAIVDDETGERIGNGDGLITAAEVAAFISEMEKRAARAEGRGDAEAAGQCRGMAEVARHLLSVIGD